MSDEQKIRDAQARYIFSQREVENWARIAKEDFDALQALLPKEQRAEYDFNRY